MTLLIGGDRLWRFIYNVPYTTGVAAMTRFRLFSRLLLVFGLLALALLPAKSATAQDSTAAPPRFVVFEAFLRPG
jgi:hypothetical protein